jgi:hypothetical protein
MASLNEEFQRRMAERAERGAPAAGDLRGLSRRDVQRIFGVGERQARRMIEQNRITGRGRGQREARAGQLAAERRREALARQRARMERRGLSRMNVQGTYRISKTPYRTRPGQGVRFGTGDGFFTGSQHITPAQMREYFAAVDRGDAQGADEALNAALGQAYGSGTDSLTFDDVESLDFGI